MMLCALIFLAAIIAAPLTATTLTWRAHSSCLAILSNLPVSR